jgi:putative Holliday junction resolvase
MRTLAVDLGSRRVGLALSDEGGRFATPYEVMSVSSAEQALAPILGIVKKEDVRRVVVGLPLNMDGGVGEAARGVRRWGEMLSRQGQIPVIYVDERLSSFSAEQGLIDRKRGGENITRKRKKQQLDALAAAAFLQEFLDGKLQAIS